MQGRRPLAPQQRIVRLLLDHLGVGPRRIGEAAVVHGKLGIQHVDVGDGTGHLPGAVQPARACSKCSEPNSRRANSRVPAPSAIMAANCPRGGAPIGVCSTAMCGSGTTSTAATISSASGTVMSSGGATVFTRIGQGLSHQAAPTDKKDPQGLPATAAAPARSRQADGPLAEFGQGVELLAEVGVLGQPVALHQDLRRLRPSRRRQEKPTRQRGQSQPQQLFLPQKQFAGRVQGPQHNDAGHIGDQDHAGQRRLRESATAEEARLS